MGEKAESASLTNKASADNLPEDVSLRLENLAVGYHRSPLIRDIHLAVRPGEILSLIGPNGAGKSTILKSITGQLRPMDGVVYLNGRDKSRMSGGEIAKELSMVMTNPLKTELMTCRDVVATGRYPYTGIMGILGKEDWDKVEEALAYVHAQDVAGKDFREISDGQKQRIMLARALCQEPQVLVLDEPTSYLDVRYKLEILATIRSIVKQKKLAVIMSLHELDLVRKVSDYIACVRDGAIERVGTPEEIFRGDFIAGLYELEQGSFLPISGQAELPRISGEAGVFVIGGGGSAVNTYYRLQRQEIPFAAGILTENDLEAPIARALAETVYTAPAFCPPDEELIKQAKEKIDACKKVICTVERFEAYNAFNALLWEYAAAQGKTDHRYL